MDSDFQEQHMTRALHVTGIATVLFLAGISVGYADSNPLLGTWKLTGPGYIDRNGNNYCEAIPEMTFAPTAQTMFAAATKFKPAAQGTTNVFYLVSGNKVYVSPKQSFFNAPDYLILTPSTMQTDTIGHCIYRRE
jgi:hypothetical protein